MRASLLRWFLRGAWPLPMLVSNLHALALEGWGRRHLLFASLLAAACLWAGSEWPVVLLSIFLLSGYLLLLGLWLIAARRFSVAAGLRALVLVPTASTVVRWCGLDVPSGMRVLDVHVNSHTRFESVDAFHIQIEADTQQLVEWWRGGVLGEAVLVLTNTFNRRLLRSLESHLGSLGTLERREKTVLLRELADSHTEAFLRRVHERMFGGPQPGLRSRERFDEWQVLSIHLSRRTANANANANE
jgi:hypothetical protein